MNFRKIIIIITIFIFISLQSLNSISACSCVSEEPYFNYIIEHDSIAIIKVKEISNTEKGNKIKLEVIEKINKYSKSDFPTEIMQIVLPKPFGRMDCGYSCTSHANKNANLLNELLVDKAYLVFIGNDNYLDAAVEIENGVTNQNFFSFNDGTEVKEILEKIPTYLSETTNQTFSNIFITIFITTLLILIWVRIAKFRFKQIWLIKRKE